MGRWAINRQKEYVLFGIEWDRDVDATDVSIHLWPVTIEWTSRKGALDG